MKYCKRSIGCSVLIIVHVGGVAGCGETTSEPTEKNNPTEVFSIQEGVHFLLDLGVLENTCGDDLPYGNVPFFSITIDSITTNSLTLTVPDDNDMVFECNRNGNEFSCFTIYPENTSAIKNGYTVSGVFDSATTSQMSYAVSWECINGMETECAEELAVMGINNPCSLTITGNGLYCGNDNDSLSTECLSIIENAESDGEYWEEPEEDEATEWFFSQSWTDDCTLSVEIPEQDASYYLGIAETGAVGIMRVVLKRIFVFQWNEELRSVMRSKTFLHYPVFMLSVVEVDPVLCKPGARHCFFPR